MVYRTKPEATVTRLTGSGLNKDTESAYWDGAPGGAENAVTASGFTQHVNLPILNEKNDSRGVFTPVNGGIQFNFPGTYVVEVVGSISGGAVGAREGIFLYTTGDISPLISTGLPYGAPLAYTAAASVSSARWYTAKVTVNVKTAGAKVLIQDYVQTTTSHTCTISKIHATKIVQGGPGPQGNKGDQGDQGPVGTRWGYTHIWAFADSTDIACTMWDGNPPAIGDQLISLNGFAVGEVYTVSAVYPGTNNVDVIPYSPAVSLRGPQGTRWGTVNEDFTGGPGVELEAVTITMNDGGLPQPGDMVLNKHSAYPGDVYYVKSVTWNTNVGIIKKYSPVQNIRGPAGPAGDALSHWPVDSVYISFANTNPATMFGGTWVSIGAGRMLIGVDSTDAAMDAAGETGGSKTKTISVDNLPPHEHSMDHNHPAVTTSSDSHNHTLTRKSGVGSSSGMARGNGTADADATTSSDSHSHTVDLPNYTGTTGTGSGLGLNSAPMDIMPPYLAVYMWRRTA